MHKRVETLTNFPSIFMKRFDNEYLLCNDQTEPSLQLLVVHMLLQS